MQGEQRRFCPLAGFGHIAVSVETPHENGNVVDKQNITAATYSSTRRGLFVSDGYQGL
jgi:hypothetical protein